MFLLFNSSINKTDFMCFSIEILEFKLLVKIWIKPVLNPIDRSLFERIFKHEIFVLKFNIFLYFSIWELELKFDVKMEDYLIYN